MRDKSLMKQVWLLLALLLAVLCLDNFLLALNWFHGSGQDEDTEFMKKQDESGETLYEKAKQGAKSVVENVSEGGKKAKESIEETGKRTASTLSKKYEENIARPLRHWMGGRDRDEELLWPWSHFMPSPESVRPWTHAVASLGQFRTFPNEYIVYLDMPGVPKEEIEIFARGHKLRVHGTHGTCLAGSGEIDRFCLERQVDRSFNIPADVILEHIEALLKDGVLMLKLPRLQDDEEDTDWDEDAVDSAELISIFGGKRTKLKGKRIGVKDYKPTWRERAREASEAVRDTIKGKGKK